MYGPPEEDGYPDTLRKAHNAAPTQPNRGADYAPEVVESHGIEYNAADPRFHPESVRPSTRGSRTAPQLPEYSSYSGGKDQQHHGYAHTKEGGASGLEPINDTSHAIAIRSDRSAQRTRVCGVSRLAFFAVLSLLAVVIVAVGLGVGLGLQHNNKSSSDTATVTATSDAAASSSSGGASVPSPTSTVTPGVNANATCQTGIRYCGWDLIEQHLNLLQRAGSSDPYNDLYQCEQGNGIGWLEACGGAVQCQPPEHNGDGCDLQTRRSCCLPH
ncbi:hypothetical protein PG994_001045 [Apiospora phragmitis]|uniref:Uncharacterized protein n=1 Tax=Apiospora phragmitis TaxID=2905665 RepID=A0ABR1WSE4_9PEZI